MALEIDLKKYCPREALDQGLALYRERGISHPQWAVTTDGTLLLRGKAVDSFHFVSHPWLVADREGKKLLGFGCDCPEARRRHRMCEHCVSLSLAFSQEVPQNLFAWELPYDSLGKRAVPVPEYTVALSEPEPAAAPAEPPVIQAPEVLEPAVQESPLDLLPEVALPPLLTPVAPAEPEPEPEPEPAEPPAPEAPQPPALQEPPRSMEILFGHDAQGEPVLWCPNDTDRVFHTNVGIIGTMGTGKTQFAKSLLTQLIRQQHNNYDGQPLGILIFDYKGDYNETKPDFIQATGARVFKPYRLPFNPLALNPGKTFKPLLPMHTANEFKDTISQIYKLGPKQQQLLLECIVAAYRKQGIHADKPLTWGRRAPTIDQVYEIFQEASVGRTPDKLTNALDKLQQFCLFEENPAKAVSLEELLRGVVVIDLSGYDEDIQSLIIAITLNQFYAHMQTRGSSPTNGQFRQLTKLIMVDEADSFMGQDFPSLRKIMKEGREFGVGVLLSTQSLQHYIGSDDDYSRYVFTWIVHNVSDLKQRDVEYVFRLKPKSPEILKTYAAIKGLQKHESIVKLGNHDPLPIRNKPFYELIQEK